MSVEDIRGQAYGRLIVEAQAKTSDGRNGWFCRCSCGGSATVRTSELKIGRRKSCGCLQRLPRPDTPVPNQGEALIPLGRGLFARVEANDFPLINDRTWIASTRGNKWYAVGGGEYMHRIIAGAKHGEVVDHIDRDTLNNIRSNLRICTQRDNSRNRVGWSSQKTSQYKGVYLKPQGNWCAQITVNRRGIYLGRFATEESAARAYDEAAERYYGSFARKNFPETAQAIGA